MEITFLSLLPRVETQCIYAPSCNLTFISYS